VLSDLISGQNAQPTTSGLAQAGGDVWIEKVVQISPACAKPPSRWLQCGDSAVDNVEKELKIGQ